MHSDCGQCRSASTDLNTSLEERQLGISNMSSRFGMRETAPFPLSSYSEENQQFLRYR